MKSEPDTNITQSKAPEIDLEKQDDSVPSMEEFMDLLSSADEFTECFEEHEREQQEQQEKD